MKPSLEAMRRIVNPREDGIPPGSFQLLYALGYVRVDPFTGCLTLTSKGRKALKK